MEICDKLGVHFVASQSINQTTVESAELDSLIRWMGQKLQTASLIPHNFSGEYPCTCCMIRDITLIFHLDTGRGLQATGDIAAGTRLIAVAADFCYTARAARRIHPEIPAKLSSNPLDFLIIFLMLEDQLGQSSAIYPYLCFLPRQFSNTLFERINQSIDRSPDELMEKCIPAGICPDLEVLLRRQRSELMNSWNVVRSAFDYLGKDMRTGMAFRKFVWAFFAVATRTLYIRPDEPALVPFLDLFNHSPHARVGYDC